MTLSRFPNMHRIGFTLQEITTTAKAVLAKLTMMRMGNFGSPGVVQSEPLGLVRIVLPRSFFGQL